MKSPKPLKWFPAYPAFWLGFEVAVLSPAQVGALWRLVNHQWAGGFLPKNPGQLARLAGCTPEEWKAVWDGIGRFFEDAPGGVLINRFTAELGARQMNRAIQARGAAEKRWEDAKSMRPHMRPDMRPDMRWM